MKVDIISTPRIECMHICGMLIWSTAIVPPDNASRNTRRDCEHHAVAMLIRAAFGPSATLHHHDSGAPYIQIAATGRIVTSISITHCSDTAMLAIAPEGIAIGIDCEHFRPALRNVAPRILSAAELSAWGADDNLLLRAWTIKEAVYKAALTPGLPFAYGINLPSPEAFNLPEKSVASTQDGRNFKLLALNLIPCTTIALALQQPSGHLAQ